MNFCNKSIKETLSEFDSDMINGLNNNSIKKNKDKYGLNQLTKQQKPSLMSRIFSAINEPMLLILLFGFFIATGCNIGKQIMTHDGDFQECFGILFAVILSVSITLFMENSSEKAFETLNKIYDNVIVRVVRNGEIISVSQKEITCGDIVLLESGDKVIADGRLIESNDLAVNESALTGESLSVNKDADIILPVGTNLAERKNILFSGTFVSHGTGKMVVTAVGNNTEIGSIAGELSYNHNASSPLNTKLNKLGKTITIIGAVSAVVVFILSVIRLVNSGNFNFTNLQELFISCIILIIAAVPEGLPTIVAMSLALNMIKLAKGNALIKKMTATETTGAVSVICSDKTGTLTENKMTVVKVCMNEFCVTPEKIKGEHIFQNFICNSTADIIRKNGEVYKGSATECALIKAYEKSNPLIPYTEYRNRYKLVDRQPFNSITKTMVTKIDIGGTIRTLIKGAPEKVLYLCQLNNSQILKLQKEMYRHQQKARRVLCFAHCDNETADSKYIYDGYVSIEDPVRKDVRQSIKECKEAGIEVKILTGDNITTAFAIAKQLDIVDDMKEVVNASDLIKLNEEEFSKAIKHVKVIARSTPDIKLKVVRALKGQGEVVAVTGDGINDAPAIKNADVGIAMGVSGSEITKETADIVLLDDSFSTVVKAVAFGRNVYQNLQRFILFQLSVNMSALFFVVLCAVLNLRSPFNTMQLLWINVIMDGPPALTLGLEQAGKTLMKNKPVKRNDSIVNVKMLLRIIFNSLFVGTVMILQYTINFLNVAEYERGNTVFTLFILFQLFNAFNSRELGSESIFRNLVKNKVMVMTFVSVFLLHIFIVQVCYKFFSVNPMSFLSWLKVFAMSFSIVILSECYKTIYRFIRKNIIKLQKSTLKSKQKINKNCCGA